MQARRIGPCAFASRLEGKFLWGEAVSGRCGIIAFVLLPPGGERPNDEVNGLPQVYGWIPVGGI